MVFILNRSREQESVVRRDAGDPAAADRLFHCEEKK